MRKVIILVIFFISPLVLFGKNPVIKLDTALIANKSELEKSIVYSNKLLIHGKRKENFEFCIQVVNKMIDKHGEDSKQTQIAYLLLARHYISSYMPKPAKELLSFTKDIKENKPYEHSETLNRLFYSLKAELSIIKKDYKKAYMLFQKSLMQLDDKNDEEIIVKIYILNRLMFIDTNLKKFNEAEQYGKSAMSLHRKVSKNKENLDERIKTFRSYAKIYANQNKYDFAITALDAAIKIYSETETINTTEMIYLFSDYAIYSLGLHNWNDIIYNAKKSMEIQKKLKIKDNITTVINLRLIALAMQNQNKKTDANLYFEKALNLLQKTEIPSFMREELKQSIMQDMVLKKSI